MTDLRLWSSRRPAVRVVVAMTSALALAGCGGTSTYDMADVRSCIDDESSIRPAEDTVAQNASGGAFETELHGNRLTLAFGRTDTDAKRMYSAYRTLANAFNQPINDILERKGNLVTLWQDTPNDTERASLERCL